MMVVDSIGKRYGRLVVVDRAGSNKKKNAVWLCRCDCGNLTKVTGNKLRNGHTQSCGCLNRERLKEANTRHGCRRDGLYIVWKGMRQRCNDVNDTAYRNYGGRGISVCPEWDDYSEFKKWAESAGYVPVFDIDRRDNNGNYEPSNCRWVSRKTNCNNTRNNVLISYNGRTQTMTQWAEELEMNVTTLLWRYRHWNDIEKILFEPLRRR